MELSWPLSVVLWCSLRSLGHALVEVGALFQVFNDFGASPGDARVSFM